MNKMEFTKKDFLQLIKEGQLELNEMAKWANPKRRPIFKDENDPSTLVGWDVQADANDPESQRIKMIFTCDLDTFKQEHPEYMDVIQNEIGEGVDWRIVFAKTCPGMKQALKGKKTGLTQPVSKETMTKKLSPTGEIEPGKPEFFDLSSKEVGARSESETIRRDLRPILIKDIESDADLNNKLKALQIPTIVFSDIKNLDRHTRESTEEFTEMGTHSILIYPNIDSFIDSAAAAVFEDEDFHSEAKQTYLPRQFNKMYANWSKGRASNVKKTGLTPKYKLNRLGYKQEDTGVEVVSNFRLIGEKHQEEGVYGWTISFKVMFGVLEQGKEEVEGFDLFKEIVVNSSAPLGDNVGAAMKLSLNDVIDKFKEKINSLDPNDAMEKGNISQFDYENVLANVGGEELQESVKDVLIPKHKLLKIIQEAIDSEINSSEPEDVEKFDDFITKNQNNEPEGEEQTEDVVDLQVAKGSDGAYYILTADPENPQIVAKL